MIRILFMLLAFVAALLALLLQQPFLYGLAGAFLVVVLILVITSLRRRQKRHRKAQDALSRPEPAAATRPEEDLSSLGILEIRPKGRVRAAAVPGIGESRAPEPRLAERPQAEPAAEESEKPPAPAEPNGARSPAGRLAVKERLPSVHAVDTQPDAPYAALMLPYLQALRIALDAQTVCLIRHEDIALHYHLEAIVSQNAYARSGGSFTTVAPLLNASEARRAVTVRRVGENGIPAANLGYYREPIAVRQVAMAPIPRRGDPVVFFLLADTMQEGVLGTPHARTILADFARLLGTLMEAPPPEEGADVTEQIRPRRDIIAEEMEKARAHRRPLALALAYLNQSEARADEGAEAVAEAEEALLSYLQKATRQGRVERFGELTFGIFYNAPVADVEAWAMRLQAELAERTGPLEGGISIGIAMLQDRHTHPDALRADATSALSEAYETGTCTIVE